MSRMCGVRMMMQEEEDSCGEGGHAVGEEGDDAGGDGQTGGRIQGVGRSAGEPKGDEEQAAEDLPAPGDPRGEEEKEPETDPGCCGAEGGMGGDGLDDEEVEPEAGPCESQQSGRTLQQREIHEETPAESIAPAGR